MKVCILDGEQITDKHQLHDILAESLDFPDWYGRNLDAMYDCLTEIREETEIHLVHMPVLETNLGRYAGQLMKVLCTVSEENAAIYLKTDEKKG